MAKTNRITFFDDINTRETAVRRCQKKSDGRGQPIGYTNRTINKFIESINQMNQVVLVPSRLRDIEVMNNDAGGVAVPGADLYQYYQMLNSVKNDFVDGGNSMIMWTDQNNNPRSFCEFTRDRHASEDSGPQSIMSISGYSSMSSTASLSSNSSTSSMSSMSSAVSCGSSSDTEEMSDSWSIDPQTAQMTGALMEHLHSMYAILKQFSATAEFIASKYLEEVDGSGQ